MDFFAIGDVVVDVFLRLKDAAVHTEVHGEDREVCLPWGGKIPYESATVVPAGGDSANAAVAAARLGLKSGLRSHVGADGYGQDCIASLRADGVDTTYIEKVFGKQTNYHYVLWYSGQRTILVKHETYDYSMPALPEPPLWIYLSSLPENSLDFHRVFMESIARWPDTKLVFQPGTFQLKMGKDALAKVYARTDVFFCNKEEAEQILGLSASADPKELLSGIKALGPKIVVVTDGLKGAYALDTEGKSWHAPRYPDPRAPYETTGAGDAFASSASVALALGKPLTEALMWGSANAASVVQQIGPQKGLLSREQLEKMIAESPAPFEPKNI